VSIQVGGIYRSSIVVKDSTGALATPASSTFTVTRPDQTTVTVAATVDSVGNLHADFTMAMEGLHRFDWVTTGPVTSQTDYESAILYRSVVGLNQMRTYLQLSDTSRDPVLKGFMHVATSMAENIVGTCVVRTVTSQHIPGTAKTVLRLPDAPLISVTSIASVWTGGPQWVTADLMVYADSGVIEPVNMLGFWYGPWTATYVAGRAVVSQRIVLAVQEIVADLWASQRGLINDALTPDMSGEALIEAQVPSGYTMPAHARAMLKRAGAQPGFA
jgi:hypothetical protein